MTGRLPPCEHLRRRPRAIAPLLASLVILASPAGRADDTTPPAAPLAAPVPPAEAAPGQSAPAPTTPADSAPAEPPATPAVAEGAPATAGELPPPRPPEAVEQDPCLINAPRLTPDGTDGDALDWTRDWLYRSVCNSAYWFDSFFGEERFDDAAQGLRGNAFLVFERRQGRGFKFKPGLRVRVPFPNLSRRFDLFFDRDDELATIEGRADSQNPTALSQGNVPGDRDSSQVGIAYRVFQEIDELLNFRAGVRLRSAQLRPFVQGRYRKEFWKTEATQWRFTETLFWRRPDGFGETTDVEFEAILSRSLLFRWFNNATLSETTQDFAWQSGLALYKDLGEARAVQGVVSAVGETGSPVDVANYQVRVSYRQTLGRPWLFGEVFAGVDWPRSVEDLERRQEAFGGLRMEIHFGR